MGLYLRRDAYCIKAGKMNAMKTPGGGRVARTGSQGESSAMARSGAARVVVTGQACKLNDDGQLVLKGAEHKRRHRDREPAAEAPPP